MLKFVALIRFVSIIFVKTFDVNIEDANIFTVFSEEAFIDEADSVFVNNELVKVLAAYKIPVLIELVVIWNALILHAVNKFVLILFVNISCVIIWATFKIPALTVDTIRIFVLKMAGIGFAVEI